MAAGEEFEGQSQNYEAQDLGQEAEIPEGAEDTGEAGDSQQEPTVEIGGKQYKLSEVAEWQKGYMRQSDYTQKTQGLAQQRQQMDELRQHAQAWKTVQEHPELMHALGTAIAQILQGQQAGPATEGQVPGAEAGAEGQQPWDQRLRQIESSLGTVLGAYDQRFQDYNKWAWDNYYANRVSYAEGSIPKLQEKYPFLVADEVIAAYRDNQDFDLEEVAKASNEHWQSWYSDRQKANIQKRKENATARVAVPAAKAGGPAIQTQQPKDWDDAFRSALERLKKVGGPTS